MVPLASAPADNFEELLVKILQLYQRRLPEFQKPVRDDLVQKSLWAMISISKSLNPRFPARLREELVPLLLQAEEQLKDQLRRIP